MSFVSTSFVNFCLFIILKFSFHTHRKRKCNTLEFWFFFFVSSDTIFLFPVTWWSMGKMELPVCCFVVTFFLIEEIDLLLMLGAEEPEIQTRYNFSRLVLCLYTQCCRFCFAFCFAFAHLITIFTVLLVSVDFKTFARHGRFPSP